MFWKVLLFLKASIIRVLVVNKKESNSGRKSSFFERCPIKKLICWTVLSVFIFNTVLQDAALAFESPVTTSVQDNMSLGQKSAIGIDVSSFDLPKELGTVKKRYASENPDGVVIHIRDAHGNYACQKKIAEIIGHIYEKYDISIVNLEGGKGEYDLELFNETENTHIRYKVADQFLKEGFLNGAEFFSIISSGKTDLWGVEDSELYARNLKLFRASLKSRGEAMRQLSQIDRKLKRLKKSLFSEELFLFYQSLSDLKEKDEDLEGYLSFLLSAAEKKGLEKSPFSNLHLLQKAYSFESEIDFGEANAQRDEFLNSLKEKLSVRQLSELVSMIQSLQKGRITDSEFYDHLLSQAERRDLAISDHPTFANYIAYRNTYRKLNTSAVPEEKRLLEKNLLLEKAKCDSEKELLLASSDLDLLKSLLIGRISSEEHALYEKRKNDLGAGRFVELVNKEQKRTSEVSAVSIDVPLVDGALDKMARFYKYANKRDEAFVENLRMESLEDGPGGNYGMLVTGGFHSDNLARVLRNRGYSYVSIMPEFTSEDDHENPYFELLAGKKIGILRSLNASVSAIQLPSYWNALGQELSATNAQLARAALVAANQAEVKGSFAIRATGTESKEAGYLLFEKGPDSYRFEFVKSDHPALKDATAYELPSRGPVDLQDPHQLFSALKEVAKGRAVKRDFTVKSDDPGDKIPSRRARPAVPFRLARMNKKFSEARALLKGAIDGLALHAPEQAARSGWQKNTPEESQREKRGFSPNSYLIKNGITDAIYLSKDGESHKALDSLYELVKIFDQYSSEDPDVQKKGRKLIVAFCGIATDFMKQDRNGQKAQEALQGALDLFQAHKHQEPEILQQAEYLVSIYKNLAIFYKERGEMEKGSEILEFAKDLYNSSLDMAPPDEVLMVGEHLITAYLSFAKKHRQQKRTRKAEEALEVAFDIFNAQKNIDEKVRSIGPYLISAYTNLADQYFRVGKNPDNIIRNVNRARRLFEELKDESLTVRAQAQYLLTGYTKYINKCFRTMPDKKTYESMYEAYKEARSIFKSYHQTEPDLKTQATFLMIAGSRLISYYTFRENFARAESIVFDNLHIMDHTLFDNDAVIDQAGHLFARMVVLLTKLADRGEEEDLKSIGRILPEAKKFLRIYDYFLRGQDKKDFARLLKRINDTDSASGEKRSEFPRGGMWGFMRPFYERMASEHGSFFGKVIVPVVVESVFFQGAFTLASYLLLGDAVPGAIISVAFWTAFHFRTLRRDSAPLQIAFFTVAALLGIWHLGEAASVSLALSLGATSLLHASANSIFLFDGTRASFLGSKDRSTTAGVRISSEDLPAYADSSGGKFSPRAVKIKKLVRQALVNIDEKDLLGAQEAVKEARTIFQQKKAFNEQVRKTAKRILVVHHVLVTKHIKTHNDLQNAETVLKEYRDLFEEADKDDPEVLKQAEYLVSAYKNMALAHRNSNDPLRAEEYLTEARNLFEEYKKTDEKMAQQAAFLIRTYTIVSLCFRANKDYDGSRRMLNSAFDILKEHGENDKKVREQAKFILKGYTKHANNLVDSLETLEEAGIALDVALGILKEHEKEEDVHIQTSLLMKVYAVYAKRMLKSGLPGAQEKASGALQQAEELFDAYKEVDEDMWINAAFLIKAHNSFISHYIIEKKYPKAERTVRMADRVLRESVQKQQDIVVQAKYVFNKIMEVLLKLEEDKGLEKETRIHGLSDLAKDFLEDFEPFLFGHDKERYGNFRERIRKKREDSQELREQQRPQTVPEAIYESQFEEPETYYAKRPKAKKEVPKEKHNIDDRMKELRRAVEEKDLRTIRSVLPFLEEKRKKAEKRGNPFREEHLKLLERAQKTLNAPGGEWPFLSAFYQRAEEERGAFTGRVVMPVVLETVLPGAAVIAGAAFFALPAQLAAGIYLALWLSLHYGGLREQKAPLKIAFFSALALITAGSVAGNVLLEAFFSLASLIAPHAYVNYSSIARPYSEGAAIRKAPGISSRATFAKRDLPALAQIGDPGEHSAASEMTDLLKRTKFFVQRNLFEEAEETLARARKIFYEHKSSDPGVVEKVEFLISSHRSVAECYLFNERLEKARELLDTAYELFNRYKEDDRKVLFLGKLLAKDYAHLAKQYRYKNAREESEQSLDRAVSIFEENKGRDNKLKYKARLICKTYIQLALYYIEEEDFSAAEASLKKSVQFFKRYRYSVEAMAKQAEYIISGHVKLAIALLKSNVSAKTPRAEQAFAVAEATYEIYMDQDEKVRDQTVYMLIAAHKIAMNFQKRDKLEKAENHVRKSIELLDRTAAESIKDLYHADNIFETLLRLMQKIDKGRQATEPKVKELIALAEKVLENYEDFIQPHQKRKFARFISEREEKEKKSFEWKEYEPVDGDPKEQKSSPVRAEPEEEPKAGEKSSALSAHLEAISAMREQEKQAQREEPKKEKKKASNIDERIKELRKAVNEHDRNKIREILPILEKKSRKAVAKGNPFREEYVQLLEKARRTLNAPGGEWPFLSAFYQSAEEERGAFTGRVMMPVVLETVLPGAAVIAGAAFFSLPAELAAGIYLAVWLALHYKVLREQKAPLKIAFFSALALITAGSVPGEFLLEAFFSMTSLIAPHAYINYSSISHFAPEGLAKRKAPGLSYRATFARRALPALAQVEGPRGYSAFSEMKDLLKSTKGHIKNNQFKRAEETLDRAREIFYEHENTDPGVVEKVEFLVSSHIALAACYLFNEKPEKAHEFLDEAYELFNRYKQEDREVLLLGGLLVKNYAVLTKKYRNNNSIEESEQSLKTAARIFEENKGKDKELKYKAPFICQTYTQQAWYYMDKGDVLSAEASLKGGLQFFENYIYSLEPMAKQTQYIVSGYVRLALSFINSRTSEKIERAEEAFEVAEAIYERHREQDKNVKEQTVYMLIAANRISMNFQRRGKLEKAEKNVRKSIELLDRTASESKENLYHADSLFENLLSLMHKIDKGRQETEPKVEELIAHTKRILKDYEQFIQRPRKRKFGRFIREREEKKKKSFEWKEQGPGEEDSAERESATVRPEKKEELLASGKKQSALRTHLEAISALREQEKQAQREEPKKEKKKASNIDERMKDLRRAIEENDLRTIRSLLPVLKEKSKKAEAKGNPFREEHRKLLERAQRTLNAPGGEWPFLSAFYQRAEEERGAFFGKVVMPVVLETVLPGAAVIAGAAYFSLPAQLAAGIYLAVWLALHYKVLREQKAPLKIAFFSALALITAGSVPGEVLLESGFSMMSLIAPHAYINYRQKSASSATLSEKRSGLNLKVLGVLTGGISFVALGGFDLLTAEVMFPGDLLEKAVLFAFLGVLTPPGKIDDALLFGDLGNEAFIERVKEMKHKGLNAPEGEAEGEKIVFPVNIIKEDTLIRGDRLAGLEFKAERKKKKLSIRIISPSKSKPASSTESALFSNYQKALSRLQKDFGLSDEDINIKVKITNDISPEPGTRSGYVPLSSYDPKEQVIEIHPIILKAPSSVLELILFNTLVSRRKRGLSMNTFPHPAWQDTLVFLTWNSDFREEVGLFFEFLDGLDLIEPGNKAVNSLKGYDPIDYVEIDIDPALPLDDKHRLTFPKPLKDVFKERGIKGFFVVRGDDPKESMALAHDVYSLGLLLRDTGRDPREVSFEWIKLDKQGRINLGPYKEEILPDRRIMLVRLGPMLEVLTKENYDIVVEQHQKSWRDENPLKSKSGKHLLSGLLLFGGLSAMLLELYMGVPIFGELVFPGEAALPAGAFFLMGSTLPPQDRPDKPAEERAPEEEMTLPPKQDLEESVKEQASESAPEIISSETRTPDQHLEEQVPEQYKMEHALAEEAINSWKDTLPVDEDAFRRALFDYLKNRGISDDARLEKRDDPETLMAIRSATAIESMRHINPPHVNVVAQVAPIGSRSGAENVCREAATNFRSDYNGVSARSVIREGINSVKGYRRLIEDALRAMEGRSPRALFLVPHADKHLFVEAAEELRVLKKGAFREGLMVQYLDQGSRPDLLNQFILGVNILDHFRKMEKDPHHRPELSFLRLVSVMVESLESESGTKDRPEAILDNLLSGVLRMRKIDWESFNNKLRAWQAVVRSL